MIKLKQPLFLAIISLTVVFFIAQLLQNEFVFNRGQIESGQWWRVIGGNLTHSNYPHLFLNLSGLWILALLFIDTLKAKTFIFCSVFLCLIVGLGLYYFTPELHIYYGFSGALYGLFFIGGVNAALNKDVFTGISVATLILGKITWDFFQGGSSSSEELIGIPVATDAHQYGLIGAIIISILLFILHLKRNNNPSKDQKSPPHL
ncbi:rhombosortase [Cocleimonas flava]|uniref:Rhomboid family GlyGly-CTERM serine protease n=1 Tax=Cocleimonas flava TaxID=634765 RepID=A0A4R1F7L3_9GAMM|nr:rhombosortase [Cocleimonas flava]TCJ88672.1 rhomboid family GlyGly-CTERM serine protease [Cocleimonas flava]